MALKAGRVGVRPDQVDPYGKIKGSGGAKITDFEDSEEIVFSSAGTKIKSFLHQNISNKIARALLLPVQTPTEKKIVGIDTSNAEILTGYSIADAGKILSVSESGDLEWIEPPQGAGPIHGSYSAIEINAARTAFQSSSGKRTVVFDTGGKAGRYRLFFYNDNSSSGNTNIYYGTTDEMPADGVILATKTEVASLSIANLATYGFVGNIQNPDGRRWLYLTVTGFDVEGSSTQADVIKIDN